jgi:hypothetical protein
VASARPIRVVFDAQFAAVTSARTQGSALSAQSTDTALAAENVASNPRGDWSPNRRPSVAPVAGSRPSSQAEFTRLGAGAATRHVSHRNADLS